MNVGLVVEGATDLATYPVFIRRIRNDLGELQIRECGGSRLKNLFPKFLSEFDRNSAWRIDLALVIRDSDCKAPQESEAKLREILRHCNFRRRFRVEVFATPCMLESWLLSDVGAVAQ